MNKRTKRIVIASILSLLFHVGIIWLFNLLQPYFMDDALPKSKTQAITVFFPENKPKSEQPNFIVENENETDHVPENANLLSEKNSRAQNPDASKPINPNNPNSDGNVNFPDLSSAAGKKLPPQKFTKKSFNSSALTGKQVDKLKTGEGDSPEEAQQREYEKQARAGNRGTNLRLKQKDFSVEEVGSLSLSTYAWPWAPYIKKFKEKHQHVWTTPPAYNRLGLISGSTKVVFTISRSGELLDLKLIDHKGHKSLQTSSIQSIKAAFPFLPLPKEFPDEFLTITAILVYPDLRKLYNNRR